MRKHIKNEIFKILDTVNKALKLSENQTDEKAALFSETCLTTLESVRVTIKLASDNEKYPEYDKCINNIKNAISEKNGKVNFYTDKLRHMLKNDITYEVVFMPYKAAMWDSLESVWEAAANDKRCFCSVVPMPYYDRDENGQLSEYHYEGDLFPENVPIVHYDDYNLNYYKPDVIYIHNPYDQYNRILSVDPRFYIEQLKKECGMVVYIPYFISEDENVNEHYIETPGAAFADLVVLQSEKVSNRYIEVMRNEFNINRSKNIVGLGSPKIDAVLKYEVNKPDIPDEWSEIIKGRKTILYNTHINLFMDNGQKAISKLRYVFSCFNGRDDAVLLWRPHPLIQAVLKSHRPDIYKQYIQLRQEFIDSCIGIIDETADIHRAIAISDAYFGDMSSMVTMYKITGKPIMIEDVDFSDDEGYHKLNSSSVVIKEKKIYIFSEDVNGLFECDISGDTSHLLTIIPDENMFDRYMYSTMVTCNNKLILVPLRAKYIYEYDLSSGKLTRVNLDLEGQSFFSYIESEEYFFFMPYKGEKIIRYNKLTQKYEVFTQWYNSISCYNSEDGECVFRSGAVLIKDKIFVPCFQAPVIVEFDINSAQATAHEIACSLQGFGAMDYDGNDFWISSSSTGAIVKWNNQKNTVVEYNIYPDGFEERILGFSDIINCDDYILAVPWMANMFVKINKNDGVMSHFNSGILNKSRFIRSVRMGNKVLCNCSSDNKKYIIDIKTGDIEIKTLNNPDDFNDVYLNNDWINYSDQINENNYDSLEKFISCIAGKENTKTYKTAENKKYGEIIHDYVINKALADINK